MSILSNTEYRKTKGRTIMRDKRSQRKKPRHMRKRGC